MGSGLVYAAVGLVWAWYAASRAVHVRAERRADQESAAHTRVVRRAAAGDPAGADGVAAGETVAQALLQTTDAPAARRLGPHRRRSVVGSVPGPGAVAARPEDAAAARAVGASPDPRVPGVSWFAHRAAVRRRRIVLAVLVAASLAIGASVALGHRPSWVAAPLPLLSLLHLAAGARASRRSAGGRVATGHAAAVTSAADDPSWAGVPYVDVVADWCRVAPTEQTARDAAHIDAGSTTSASAESEAERLEAARLRSASTPAVEGAGSRSGSWRAVPVPLPTYVTAPRVARTVKTIDLGSTGAWTSGRSARVPLALPIAAAGPSTVDPVDGPVTADGAVSGATTGSSQDDGEDTAAIELPRAATG